MGLEGSVDAQHQESPDCRDHQQLDKGEAGSGAGRRLQGHGRTEGDDPLFDLQYGEFTRSLETLHAVTLGEAIDIGVIDSGVDLEHPDLAGQVRSHKALVPELAGEQRLHGTAVTGVIGAAAGNGEGLVGIAPRAGIHVFAACTREDGKTVCTSFSIARALAEALEDGMDVINMSFAGPHDPLIAALIDEASARDTILVAAGNPDDPARQFPATLPAVSSYGISVPTVSVAG